MQTTIVITIPNYILAHHCSEKRCKHDIIKTKANFEGVDFFIHPPFYSESKEASIFPTVRFGDLKFANFRNLKNQEFLRVAPKFSVKDTKQCNTFRIDFPKEIGIKRIEKIEEQLIIKLMSLIRKYTNQYWVNASKFQTQKIYESFHLKMKTFNLFEGTFHSDVVKASSPLNYPIKILHLNQNLWQDCLKDLNEDNKEISNSKFLDGINSLQIGDRESMILNFAISIEIKKNLLFKEIWKLQNQEKDYSEYNQEDLGIKDYNLPSHISKHLKRSIINVSFKDEHPEDYKQISYIWKFRGNIAHGEKSVINHDVQNIRLSEIDTEAIIKSVIKLTEYLESQILNVKSNGI